MELLDEFKYQAYSHRIELLKGSKQPLVDLLKQLAELYGRHTYYTELDRQITCMYFILLYNQIVSNCTASRISNKEIDKLVTSNFKWCYMGLTEETIKYWDILISAKETIIWYPKNMPEIINLNQLLSTVPYSNRISIDFSNLAVIANALPYYGNDKKLIINQYLINQLGPDAPILAYGPLLDKSRPLDKTINYQPYLDIAQSIKQLKESNDN